MFTYYKRKEYRVQIADRWGAVAAATWFRRPAETTSIHRIAIARPQPARPWRGRAELVARHYRSFPSFFALLFVMFKRHVQTADHFRSGFEERLRFRFIYFVNVAAQMFD